MEATTTILLRPAARRSLTSTRTALKQQMRTKATAARTKRSLNIPPHPSFLAPDAALEQDTIIFNPPSAAPSVYHTPFKFLPKTDPRRRANLASLFESHFSAEAAVPSSSSPAGIQDLPVVRPAQVAPGSRDPITREQVEEMRELRAADPFKWSVKALSKKYDIPQVFVQACCRAPPEKIEFERRKMELIQKRWGPSKRKAHEDRLRRSEMLYRGEL